MSTGESPSGLPVELWLRVGVYNARRTGFLYEEWRLKMGQECVYSVRSPAVNRLYKERVNHFADAGISFVRLIPSSNVIQYPRQLLKTHKRQFYYYCDLHGPLVMQATNCGGCARRIEITRERSAPAE